MSEHGTSEIKQRNHLAPDNLKEEARREGSYTKRIGDEWGGEKTKLFKINGSKSQGPNLMTNETDWKHIMDKIK